MTLAYLLAYAYNVQFFQVAGPDWTTRDRFNIEAKIPDGVAKTDDRSMLKTLLKERFQLVFHVEKRQLESYALLVAEHGSKLRLSPVQETDPASGSVSDDRKKNGTQTTKFDPSTYTQHWEASNMTMQDLAKRLSVCIDLTYHDVIDLTELKGSYQVAYDCPVPRPRKPFSTDMDGFTPETSPNDDALARSLVQLGLKLEKRKLPQDVYVIERVDKPSEN